MSYEKERELLKITIEEKKQEEINRLENIQKEIDKCTNPVDLLMMFVEIYGNTTEQSEKMVSFIRSFAKDEFFKLATIKYLANYLAFTYQDLTIMFSTSRCREIVVKNNLDIQIPTKVKPLDDSYKRMANSCKKYLLDKTEENLRIFTIDYLNVYYSYPQKEYKEYSFFEKLHINKNAKKLKQKNIETLYNEFIEKIKKNQIDLLLYKKTIKKYNTELKRLNDLFNSLETMKLFNEKEWFFKFEKLETPLWIKNTTDRKYF